MWFHDLMDDCKTGLDIARSNIVIFVPGIISAITTFILAGITLLGLFVLLPLVFAAADRELFLFIPLFLTVIIILGALLFTALQSFFEAGAYNILAAVSDGVQPRLAHFWTGTRDYFLRFWGTYLILCLIPFLLSPLLITVLIPYALTVGILTAGWGLLALVVLWAVFFSAWPAALVIDNLSIRKALGASIKLGRIFFWGMFILGLASIMLSQYLSSAFGLPIFYLAGWLIGIVIHVYFNLVVLLVYKRKREYLLQESALLNPGK